MYLLYRTKRKGKKRIRTSRVKRKERYLLSRRLKERQKVRVRKLKKKR